MNPPAAVSREIEQTLVKLARQMPRADYLEPFVAGARDVLEQELGTEVRPGKLAVESGSCTTQDVTTVVGITGQLTGLALYGMSAETALAIVSRLMGEPIAVLDDLAMSGVGELGNVITGRASTLLGEIGIAVQIAPPVLLSGAGSRVSTAGIQRLVVPLATDLGVIEAQLAIKGMG